MKGKQCFSQRDVALDDTEFSTSVACTRILGISRAGKMLCAPDMNLYVDKLTYYADVNCFTSFGTGKALRHIHSPYNIMISSWKSFMIFKLNGTFFK